MNVCILGAGAVGTVLAVRLHRAGVNVSVLARPSTVPLLRQVGLRVQGSNGSIETANPAIISHVNELDRPPDVAILAVKGHALAGLVPQLVGLSGGATLLVSAMNGIPWWFFDALRARRPGQRMAQVGSTDFRELKACFPLEKLAGCVVFAHSYQMAPGVVHHSFGNEYTLGLAAGGSSPELGALVAVMANAGLNAKLSSDILEAIWSKLVGNAVHNPMSALTGATCDRLLAEPMCLSFCNSLMNEVIAIGRALGLSVDVDPHALNRRIASYGAFKTSMLQDVEKRTVLELDTLVYRVLDAGLAANLSLPHFETLVGLLKLRFS